MAQDFARSSTVDLYHDISSGIEAALLPLLNDAVVKYESKNLAESKEKDRQLRAATARISDLEAQLSAANQARIGVQQALDTYLRGKNELAKLDDKTSSQANVPFEEHRLLQLKADALTKQLNEAIERQRTEAQARHLLITKLKTAKATAREWMLLAEKRDPRKPKATLGSSFHNPPPISPVVENFLSNNALDVAARENCSISSPNDNYMIQPQEISSIKRQVGNTNIANQNLEITVHQEAASNIPSSQQETVPPEFDNTIGYAANRIIPDSDDEPLVVEERRVKRRRKSKVQIKQEIISPQHTRHTLHLVGTLDLDDIGEQLITPRRQQALDVEFSQQSPHIGFERPSSEPPQSQIPGLNSDVTIKILEEENINPEGRSQSHPPIVKRGLLSSPAEPIRDRKRQILAAIDGNVQSRSTRGNKSKRHSIENAIRNMCEDGCVSQVADSLVQVTEPTTNADSAIQALLNGDGLQTLPAKKIQSIFKSKTHKRRADQMRAGGSSIVEMPVSTSNSMVNPRLPVTPTDQIAQACLRPPSRSNLRPRIRAKCLRDRPKESLTISDFKINPQINSGLDFAFGEAVYGDARKCFPGCTDPRCCGDAFRLLASTLKPTLPRPAFPASQEDATLTDDEFLLKWHMGSAWNLESIRNMNEEEQHRHLLDARTRLLAERHGKHRLVGDRRMTPPGYWDMDMPSTQEIENQRREAQRIERQMVEERYNEAIRGGGKWLFADE